MRLELVCEIEAGRRDKAFRDRLQGVAWGERLRGVLQMSHRLRRSADGLTLRDAHGEITTEDHATVSFSLQGRTVHSESKESQLLSVLFDTKDKRYNWLNRTFCVLEGKFDASSMTFRAKVYSCESDVA
jgi:hypothetical protein